jgi:hypothetical protein
MDRGVSRWCENFSIEGEGRLDALGFAQFLDDLKRQRKSVHYGVSKREELISDFYGANGLRSTVGV